MTEPTQDAERYKWRQQTIGNVIVVKRLKPGHSGVYQYMTADYANYLEAVLRSALAAQAAADRQGDAG